MIGTSLLSQYKLIDSISASDAEAIQFGKNIQWLSTDIFAVTSNLATPFVSNDINFTDGAYFDGGGTEFGQVFTSSSQKLDIFQVLKTNRTWINSPSDILNPTIVATVPITGNSGVSSIYAGAIDNLFISDAGNPDEAIKIFNNPTLTHGWAVFTAQQQQLDSGSIGRAWIYDSITQIKLADLEVVDVFAGILPGTIASGLDYICDIDPACYNIPFWLPSNIYNIGDRVMYNGQTYQSLFAGKSGSIFNASLWSLVTTQPNFNTEGIIKWGAAQVGRTWFKTTKLKAINAQLGTLTERAQNWNQWFPNASIEIFEWVNSSTPPISYINNITNGFVLDINCPYTYDPITGLYGFWVYGKDSIGPIHDQTTASQIVAVSDIPNSGIPMITAIDTNAVAVWNINQFVSANTVILHIDYIKESSDNLLHNEFALISNDGTKSWYNTTIYPKFVDSLSGVNDNNQLVPDYTIPNNQQTGILNNPVQSLFVDRTAAVNIYFTTINQQLANLAIATTAVVTELSAVDPIPVTGFNEQISDRNVLNGLDPSLFPNNYRILLTQDNTLDPVAWSIVSNNNGSWQIAQYQLYNLANNWEYADWFATNYTNKTPTYVLSNIGELSSITYVAGDIVQIDNNGSGNRIIFLASLNDIDPSVTELDPIYIQNGTIQFLPNLYNFLASGIGFDNQPFDSQPFDNDPYLQIRLITQILNNTVFVGSDTLTSAADDGFYSILTFILFENQNLDWLFKTSFVTVDYNNRNLNVQGTYEPDNQSAIEDFVSETLPYHVRVREFRDTYSATDYGNIGAVDFDLPAQYDFNYANVVYNFGQNAKYNSQLPLSVFRENVGVSSDFNSCYIRSNGVPITNNYNFQYIVTENNLNLLTESNELLITQAINIFGVRDWQFGIVKTPITEKIKYDTVPNTLGPIAVAIDGVPFYGPNSGLTETLYLTGNISQPLANINTNTTLTINNVWAAEQAILDPGLGYVNITGVYQYSANPYAMANASIGAHSPIIGYAWDGNPIYGPYGYANANGTGGIIVNTPSYQLSTIPRLDKTGQPIINGLQMAVYVSPTGEYIEDFIYQPNSGTLDECNGRFVVTPDYPTGTYAYFATVSTANVAVPAYPYIIGPCYNSRPFGLKYVYVDGINTPTYINGNANIQVIPYANTVSFVRSPDGGSSSDNITLQEPIYAPWNNNHTYSINTINVERPGIGYLGLTGNVIINPTNNASANISSLQVVSANLVISGNNYSIGDILSFVGGTYGNAGNIQVNTVNVSNSNSIVTFTLLPSENQNYTVLPSNIANVSTSCLTSDGTGAIFTIAFGLESVLVTNNGNNFTYTPDVTIVDANASISATVYPILDNDLIRSFNTTLSFDRVNTAPYSGVVVDSGEFIGSYIVPNGTIFDSNDATAGITALNISWRPELINDTSLSYEYSRFGNSSGVFNGALGQYMIANINSPSISDISIDSSNFTVEFFVNSSNLSSNLSVMFDTRANIASNNGLVIFIDNGNLCLGSNTNVSIISTNTIPFATNEWEYITVQGNNGNLYSYMNGQLLGSANISYNFSDSYLTLGADVSGGNVFTGYIDELRITQSYNRYVPGIINITVPTSPFPRSLIVDPYLLARYTPILYGFENLFNESEADITFIPINAQTLITDLSWNQKKLQLIGYGPNLIIDGTPINQIIDPQTSEILAVTLNQG